MASNISETVIDYDPVGRSYGIPFRKNSISSIEYCPWCSSQLPKDLIHEWFDILENEYKIEVPDSTTLTNVPEEFKSDAWWKKRGL